MIEVASALEHHLHAVLPHLSRGARVIVDVIRLRQGKVGSTVLAAQLFGLPSRFALARLLRREGLPGLHELAAWISVLGWVVAAERSRVSLFVIASHSGRSPPVCYRTVRRLTGLTWAQLVARGSPWVLRLFIDRCQMLRRESGSPQARRRKRRVAGPARARGLTGSSTVVQCD
jgi:hypothetical protein